MQKAEASPKAVDVVVSLLFTTGMITTWRYDMGVYITADVCADAVANDIQGVQPKAPMTIIACVIYDNGDWSPSMFTLEAWNDEECSKIKEAIKQGIGETATEQ